MVGSAAAVVVNSPRTLAQTASKTLTSALQRDVETNTPVGQRESKECVLATTSKRMAEHGSKTCLSAVPKSAAQCRKRLMVSRFVSLVGARIQTGTVVIATTIQTCACKSTRIATSGRARRLEMKAIVLSEMVSTGRSAKRP